MPLANYSELQTAIGNWLNRSDLTSLIPDFIMLFEKRANRVLRVPEMEASATSSVTSSLVALPTDFLQLRELRVGGKVIPGWDPQALRDYYQNASAGTVQGYAVLDTNILLQPAPSAAVTVAITYFQAIPALSASQTTNWLLTKHPDIYLSGCLAVARAYMVDPENAGQAAMAADGFLAELRMMGVKQRLPAGPLVMRPGVAE